MKSSLALPQALRPYFRPHLGRLITAYVAMIVLALASAVYAFLAGPALQTVFTGNLAGAMLDQQGNLRRGLDWLPQGIAEWSRQQLVTNQLWILPAAIVAVALIRGIAQTVQFTLSGTLAQNILFAIRRDAFSAILVQDGGFFEHRSHGELLSRLTHDGQIVEQAVFYGVTPILRDTLSVLFLLGLCFFLDPQLALVTFILVPLAVLPLARFAKWLKVVSRVGQEAHADVESVCYESLAGADVLQSLGAEHLAVKRLDAAAGRYQASMQRSYALRAVRTPVMETLGACALAGMLVLLTYWVQQGTGDPARFVTFLTAMLMMYDPLKKLGQVSDYLAAGSAAFERLKAIIDLASRPIATQPPLPVPLREGVTFEHLHFAYPDGRRVLSDFSLRIGHGETVALVGASGAGKTTLVKLLLRRYDPTAGQIRFDAQDLKTVEPERVRASIAWVGQDPFLFNSGIDENLRLAAPNASDADLRTALADAGALAFVDALPQGIQTRVGERGIRLSGGQRQRLVLARALLCEAPLLVLDEATSHLDGETEALITEALNTRLRNKTVLIIAHRLATVRRADRIAVLEHGRLVESGTHRELMDKGGTYTRLAAVTPDAQNTRETPAFAVG